MLTTAEVRLSAGPVVPAVLASASIPGAFLPSRSTASRASTVAFVNNTPIPHAIDLGADELWVLPTGFSCALREPPRSALGMALHGINALVHQRLAHDVEHRALDDVVLRVVPPPCPIRTAPTDFSASDELIRRGYDAACRAIDTPPTPLRDIARLRPHSHPHPDPASDSESPLSSTA